MRPHDSWTLSALGKSPGAEPRASCAQCPMCDSPDWAREIRPQFRTDTRCCTYMPLLPNWLVGQLLADPSPDIAEGQGRMRQRIAERRGCTPFGALRSPAFSRRFAAEGPTAFGRDPDLLCPYAVGAEARCSIWRHRNAVCSTWHCQVEDGVSGHQAWRALGELLSAAERALAAAIVVELDPGESALELLFAEDGQPHLELSDLAGRVEEDGRVESGLYRRLWGRWLGREEAWYRAAGERAAVTSWEEVRRLGGPALRVLEQRCLTAWQRRGQRPLRLERGALAVGFSAAPCSGGLAVAHLDTQLQPIRLREGLWQRLLQLRGASSPDELLLQLGLSEAELQELIDHQLLRPAQGRVEAGPLQPRSRLRLPPGVPAALLSDPHRLQVGTALLELGEAEDLRWAERLLSRRHGFTVLEAAGWAHLPPGEARARLQRLVEAGVLEGA